MNDIIIRDLQGRPITYICQCGSWWFPSPTHGFTMCPGEALFGEGTCPDRNHGLSRRKPRRKYRKKGRGQRTMEGGPLIGMWGKPV